MPDEVSYLLDWFSELQRGRTSSGFSFNPLSYTEIDSWARLTRRSLSPFELQLLKDLDMLYISSRLRADNATADHDGR